MSKGLSYKDAGVDISVADAAKREMADTLLSDNSRVLNKVGAFASLFDGRFPEYQHPVLVCKTEEPGSKQKLAFKLGRYRSICYDLINHLVNDIVVMGAKPLAVQDCIVCGKLEKAVVTEVVKGIAKACEAQGCVLTGGETSEQPGVLEAGTYILTASIFGVVEKTRVLDGSQIRSGDVVLALPSNGLHTNGYSLVRKLLEQDSTLAEYEVAGESFLDAILRPHYCYYQNIKDLFELPGVRGFAHITGGGIAGNLNRILPVGLNARINLSQLRVLPLFKVIRDRGGVSDEVMLQTFNLGVGMCAVVSAQALPTTMQHLKNSGIEPYQIGEIDSGSQQVEFVGELRW